MEDIKIIYKLTTSQNTTRNSCLWIPEEWKKTSGDGNLCGPGWLHAYNDPLVAIFMNPLHASIADPILWQGEARGKFLDDKGLKCGYSEMRIIKRMMPYKFTPEKLVEIAIICAIEAGYDDENFISWTCHWMDRSDRSQETARVAAAEATEAAWAAWAARAAARAAAAWAARATEAVATEAAAAAAEAAAEAEAEAEASGFNLSKILHELCD
jgi:hypothetical protein